MKFILFFICLVTFLFMGESMAQQNINKLSTKELTVNGKMEVNSTTLSSKPCPAMTETQRNAIATPANGSCVYNTTTLQLNVYNGSIWKSAGGGISNWETAFNYAIGDVVIESNKIYQANTPHTSTVFASQLSNWTQIANNVSDVTGVVPLVNGGTNKNATASAGSVVYSDADSFELTSVGTSGQVLKSNGAGAPAFAISSIKAKAQNLSQVDADEIQAHNNQLTETASGKHLIETGNLNLLQNPGFEHTTFSTGWTTTGTTATLSAETVTIISGLKAIETVASSQNISIVQDSTLYASQIAGMQGYVQMSCSNTAPSVSLCARAAGVTSSTNCVTLDTTGAWKQYEIPVVLSATSNGISIAATSTTGTTICDDAYVGLISGKTPEVSQAQLLGTVSFASDCAWTSTQTGSFANIAADASCTITTTGRVSAPTTGIPAFRINPMPIGDYVIVQESGRLFLQGGSSDQTSNMRLSNGTSSTKTIQWGSQDSGATTTLPYHGNFTYTLENSSATDQTWQIQQFLSNATSALWNLDNETKFSIYYYPPASKIYSQRCTGFFDCENTFAAQLNTTGGVIDSSTSPAWLSCSATATTLTCTYSTALSSVLTEPMTCTGTKSGSSGGSAILIVQAGSTTGFSATSTNMTSNGTGIICVKNFPDFKEKNVITGTFAEMMRVPGVSKPKTIYYAFGGASATLAAPTECTSGTCVEVYDSHQVGSPPTRSGAGAYTNFTIADGTFAASSFLDCRCEAYDVTVDIAKLCRLYFATADQTWLTNSNGGAVLNLATSDSSSSDAFAKVTCEGSAP